METTENTQESKTCGPVQALVTTRSDHRLMHEWHVQINRFGEERGHDKFDEYKFMYEAKSAADEIPRLQMLFGRERRNQLPKGHQQCSHCAPEPVQNNHLTCCLGERCSECPMLQAIEKMDRPDDDKDFAKAMTCATHIISKGGDMAGEGFVLTVDDRMFWGNVYQSLSS